MTDIDELAAAFEKSPIDLTPTDIEHVVLHFQSLYWKSSNVTQRTVTKDPANPKKKTKPELTKELLDQLADIPLGDILP